MLIRRLGGVRSALSSAFVLVVLPLALSGCLKDSGSASSSGSSNSTPATLNVDVAPSQYSYARPSSADASRFLQQSSYGATPDTIADVENLGFEAWIDRQINIPPRSHVAYLEGIKARGEDVWVNHVMETFWEQAAAGDDQLRQRVVFALSQIFVVSTESSRLESEPWGLASYLDMLSRNAFGNYRRLLEDVSLHPAMGIYLSHIGNEKEDPSTGRLPDENFAREVLQLFSIGLSQLNADGSVKRDAGGSPIPTYDQEVVMGYAKVFTGWSWGGPDKRDNRFRGWMNGEDQAHWKLPMQSYPKFHSTSAKRILNGVTLPAGQSAEQDLAAGLDAIFNHPNVGPFIGLRLIQRLVTSNPSPAYVGRVAGVFANNGRGVRGDMAAVLKAVLLDPEARDRSRITSTTAGKVREPVLRFANWVRVAQARSDSGRYAIWNLEDPMWGLGQNPLRSPSVFNFFRPTYASPGPIARAGIVAPEYQILHETTLTGNINFFQHVIEHGYGWQDEHKVKPTYQRLTALAGTPDALVNELDRLLLYGSMSAGLRAALLATVNNVKTTEADWALKRVRAALFVTLVTPEYVVQK